MNPNILNKIDTILSSYSMVLIPLNDIIADMFFRGISEKRGNMITMIYNRLNTFQKKEFLYLLGITDNMLFSDVLSMWCYYYEAFRTRYAIQDLFFENNLDIVKAAISNKPEYNKYIEMSPLYRYTFNLNRAANVLSIIYKMKIIKNDREWIAKSEQWSPYINYLENLIVHDTLRNTIAANVALLQ